MDSRHTSSSVARQLRFCPDNQFLKLAGRRSMKCPDSLLFWNLHRYGAPLVNQGAPGKRLSFEETFALSVALARRRPDVARVMPVVLAKNSDNVNFMRLVEAASRLGQVRALGFFMDLTGRLTHGFPKAWPNFLLDRTAPFEYFFTLPWGARARKLDVDRTPALAKKWRFWMNASFESFKSCFGKFTVARA